MGWWERWCVVCVFSPFCLHLYLTTRRGNAQDDKEGWETEGSGISSQSRLVNKNLHVMSSDSQLQIYLENRKQLHEDVILWTQLKQNHSIFCSFFLFFFFFVLSDSFEEELLIMTQSWNHMYVHQHLSTPRAWEGREHAERGQRGSHVILSSTPLQW